MLGYARILNQSRGDLYENPLQGGELVKLKSGGPVMTVTENQGEGMIAAMWADKVGQMHNAIFPEQLLQRAKRRSFFGLRR